MDGANQRPFVTSRLLKDGGSELSMQFLEKLDDDISVAFESFVRVNNSKNLFKSMRTPAVLVCLMVANYFFQEIFQLFGLDYIASFFSLILVLAIFLLSSWSYARYSGKMRDFGQKIDQGVEWSWENLWKHIFTNSVQHVGPAAAAIANKKYF
uniref:Uncharacterized protein n=1 Tax=Ditylenchus dipsaci TaxID=166011 RepID=A0A915DG15_9BILA